MHIVVVAAADVEVSVVGAAAAAAVAALARRLAVQAEHIEPALGLLVVEICYTTPKFC